MFLLFYVAIMNFLFSTFYISYIIIINITIIYTVAYRNKKAQYYSLPSYLISCFI